VTEGTVVLVWSFGRALGPLVVASLVLAVPRPARAEVAVAPPPAAPETTLKLRLWAQNPELKLELYRADQRPRKVPPLHACMQSCRLDVPAGSYRLFVKGPRDGDVHASFRNFELEYPSLLTVRPPSATARGAGLFVGIVGIPVFLAGVVYMFAQSGFGGGGGLDDTHEQVITAGLLGSGISMMVGGWILFGVNRKPKLRLTVLEN
jgi:hypothetical protein